MGDRHGVIIRPEGDSIFRVAQTCSGQNWWSGCSADFLTFSFAELSPFGKEAIPLPAACQDHHLGREGRHRGRSRYGKRLLCWVCREELERHLKHPRNARYHLHVCELKQKKKSMITAASVPTFLKKYHTKKRKKIKIISLLPAIFSWLVSHFYNWYLFSCRIPLFCVANGKNLRTPADPVWSFPCGSIRKWKLKKKKKTSSIGFLASD